MKELKMLRFSLGVARVDKLKYENTRGTARVQTKLGREGMFGHVQGRENGFMW